MFTNSYKYAQTCLKISILFMQHIQFSPFHHNMNTDFSQFITIHTQNDYKVFTKIN